jgi:hypothetical protein
MYGIMNKQVKKFVKLIFFIFVFYSLNIVTLSAAEDPLSKLLNKGFKIITEQKLTESKIQPLFEEKNLFITYNSKIYEFSFDRVGFFEVFDDIQKINSGTWKISGLFQNAILLNFEKNFEEKKELYFQLYPDLKKISTLTTLVNPDSDEQTDRPVKYADKQVAKKERVSKIEKIEEEKRLALQKKITAEKEAKRIAAKKVKAEEESRLAKAEEEAKRIAAEKIKAEEEAKRIAAEKIKAEEESKRIAAEKIKAEEESKRIAAEKIKAEEEVGRLANEKQKLEKELQKYKLEENKKLFLEEEKKYGRKCTKGTFFSKRDLFEIGSEEYKTCIKNKGPEKQLEEKKRSQSEKLKAEEAKKIVDEKVKVEEEARLKAEEEARLKAEEEEEAKRIAAEKVKTEEDAKKLSIQNVYDWTNAKAAIYGICKAYNKPEFYTQALAKAFISVIDLDNVYALQSFISSNRECEVWYDAMNPIFQPRKPDGNLVLVPVRQRDGKSTKSWWTNSSCGNAGCISQIIFKFSK